MTLTRYQQRLALGQKYGNNDAAAISSGSPSSIGVGLARLTETPACVPKAVRWRNRLKRVRVELSD